MDATVAPIVDLFRSLHQQLREIVQGATSDELNWSPGPELNSVAVLVTHTLGSELDTLLLVRGIRGSRDRDAEFQVSDASADDLLAAIDVADTLLLEHGEAITPSDLDAARLRPNREPQTGLHWLVNNYGHAREHLGHLHMTRQLYQQRG